MLTPRMSERCGVRRSGASRLREPRQSGKGREEKRYQREKKGVRGRGRPERKRPPFRAGVERESAL